MAMRGDRRVSCVGGPFPRGVMVVVAVQEASPTYFTAWFLVKSLIANFVRSLQPTQIESDRRIFSLTWDDGVWARPLHRFPLANIIHR